MYYAQVVDINHKDSLHNQIIVNFIIRQISDMKKWTLLVPIMGLTLMSAMPGGSGSGAKGLIENPTAGMTLAFDQSSGTNGTAVTWNPTKKMYYAGIAGNTSYPLETFSEDGKNLHQTNTKIDLRGLWWDAAAKRLGANCYDRGGYASIAMTVEGYGGADYNSTLSGMNQPNENSVGDWYAKKKQIVFFNGESANFYSFSSGEKVKSVELKIDVPLGQINGTTIIFTGKKKMELGLLDYRKKKVYLFNMKNGSLTGTVNLPGSAITHDRFRFSYANDRVWLYDTRSRSWTAYKIFN